MEKDSSQFFHFGPLFSQIHFGQNCRITLLLSPESGSGSDAFKSLPKIMLPTPRFPTKRRKIWKRYRINFRYSSSSAAVIGFRVLATATTGSESLVAVRAFLEGKKHSKRCCYRTISRWQKWTNGFGKKVARGISFFLCFSFLPSSAIFGMGDVSSDCLYTGCLKVREKNIS